MNFEIHAGKTSGRLLRAKRPSALEITGIPVFVELVAEGPDADLECIGRLGAVSIMLSKDLQDVHLLHFSQLKRLRTTGARA